MTEHITKWVAALALAGVISSPAATDTGFDRYRVILDRKPFGQGPPPEQPAPPPPLNPNDSFAKLIRLTALLETSDGRIKAGFIDMKNNQNYYLEVGEISPAGIELVSANYDKESVILRSGAEMAELKLSSTGDFQPIAPEQQAARLAQASPGQMSYVDRRRLREEQRKLVAQPPPPPPEPPKPLLTGEALQKHLQEYQMEVIRQGLPALPIPLTEEMDAQLVAEGLLPPIE
jgi:hypothetical protein